MEQTGAEQLSLGLAKIENSHAEWLTRARTYAKQWNRKHYKVDSDVLRRAERLGFLPSPHHPNAWGAVFREGMTELGYWKTVGSKLSKLPSNHNRRIRIWIWIEPDPEFIRRVPT